MENRAHAIAAGIFTLLLALGAMIGAFSYGGQGAALYSITKAGVNRMTETLAVEWARFGINVADVQEIITTAIGGKAATHVYEGERRFQLTLRFPEPQRNSYIQISIVKTADTLSILIWGWIDKSHFFSGAAVLIHW